jgi:hypothetical protein
LAKGVEVNYNKVKLSHLWSGGYSKYQGNNMKGTGQNKIAALIALLLVGSILTTVKAKSRENRNPVIVEDLSYLNDVQTYVDSYLESQTYEEESIDIIKVFDEKGSLVLQGKLGELSDEGLKIYRQADFLAALDNTCYYRLNSR